ncbi:DMT family transporter [Photobacterium lutimaris]|uniref:EamA family transporter n=1 Tax=Photobacterium lutimaris TaxID=388278 RepID=A0A2T3J4Y3_9GAMM|nr:DMT family transporter [Photobacterium lutimaris]PSU36352.1 EamA family transporter [Photobacterium lutimaris]TDR74752.1 drug/metabolite transporter (DMT)-like permease [Photobacterium lutimaris]
MNFERRADLILVATTILAAAGWIFSKEAIQGLPPFGFIGLRFILASLCILLFCFSDIKKVEKSVIPKALGVGCILGSAILLWIHAISVSDTLGEGAFIMSLSMLFVPLIAWPLFKAKPPRTFWLALPIAFAGLLMLSLGGGNGWQISSSQLWFMAAAVMLAVHFNFNSKYARQIPTLLLTCLQLFSIGCMGSIASLLFETWPESVSLTTWGWFTMSMLVATSLRYVMQTMGQKHSTAANAAIIMILEPVWTVILSVIWYAEAMPFNKLAGCLMILLALFTYRGGPFVLRRLTRRFSQ